MTASCRSIHPWSLSLLLIVHYSLLLVLSFSCKVVQVSSRIFQVSWLRHLSLDFIERSPTPCPVTFCLLVVFGAPRSRDHPNMLQESKACQRTLIAVKSTSGFEDETGIPCLDYAGHSTYPESKPISVLACLYWNSTQREALTYNTMVPIRIASLSALSRGHLYSVFSSPWYEPPASLQNSCCENGVPGTKLDAMRRTIPATVRDAVRESHASGKRQTPNLISWVDSTIPVRDLLHCPRR